MEVMSMGGWFSTLLCSSVVSSSDSGRFSLVSSIGVVLLVEKTVFSTSEVHQSG
jgi:hypothetical protein